ncbi:MAG: hypothetical protein Q7T01_03175 [bacterium]|nr:hypothetical protein [bacterium]
MTTQTQTDSIVAPAINLEDAIVGKMGPRHTDDATGPAIPAGVALEPSASAEAPAAKKAYAPAKKTPLRKAAPRQHHACGHDRWHARAAGALCGPCGLEQGAPKGRSLVRIEHAIVTRDSKTGNSIAQNVCDECAVAYHEVRPEEQIFCSPNAALKEALLRNALNQCIPAARRDDREFRSAVVRRVRKAQPTDVSLAVLTAVEAQLAAHASLDALVDEYGKDVRDIKKRTFDLARKERLELEAAVARMRATCEQEASAAKVNRAAYAELDELVKAFGGFVPSIKTRTFDYAEANGISLAEAVKIARSHCENAAAEVQEAEQRRASWVQTQKAKGARPHDSRPAPLPQRPAREDRAVSNQPRTTLVYST